MTDFPLKIVTPDGIRFDGTAQRLKVRTTTGDVAILAGHINYVAPLGMGEVSVVIQEETCYGACIGGMVSVVDGAVTLVPTTFEWADQIDQQRAQDSRHRAEAVLARKDVTDLELSLAQARLKRALIRSSVADRRQS